MYSIQEQFKTDALAQMNGRVHDAQLIAGNMLDLSREIGMLNVRTTKASAEQIVGAVQKLLGAGNPGEFFQIAASVMQPDMQLWTSYIQQLSSIAGKAVPPKTSLNLNLGKLLAPLTAAPAVSWPEPEAPAAQAAPAAETPAIAESEQLEAALDAAPELPAPDALPYAAALEESSEEAPQAAIEPPAETVEAIREVAEAMTGANRTPPAVMAASALPPQQPAVPEIKVVRKAAARGSHKPVAPPAVKKAAPPARGASNRARKG
jgi:hypothetical protein